MSTESEQPNNCDVHLHTEIEVLKQALVEKQNQLIAMETACLRESDRQVELEDSIIAWQDKYDRLYESHKRVQKVNQNLEDKLLKLVDRNSGERAQLTSDVATLSVRLAQANYNIAKLQREIERYKADINLAIQLLQCKPDSFVPQKVSSLPMEIQSKVSSYMRLETNSHSDSEEGSTSGIGVATSNSYKVLPASDSPPPVCPFPPTAMVYSMRGLGKYAQLANSGTSNNNNNTCSNSTDQMISPSVMVKYLEEELKLNEIKHCDTCQCSNKDLTVLADISKTYTIGTQTTLQGDANTSLCLRCNNNLNSPSRTNSPYLMKLVKSSDSVISETKSSVSDLNEVDKLFTPAKKDDLMVNPILGHHRLCDRTNSKLMLHQAPAFASETTKYLMEANRKFEGDLIDLRKDDVRKTFGGDVDCKLVTIPATNDSSRKSDINNILVDTSECSSGAGLTGGESGVSGTETKGSEQSTDSIQGNLKLSEDSEKDKKNDNLQNTISGSVNSLWSKTSSGEGAKMFENFNRNLIKTIKAENPKYRGPRLCALRIQNGSSNILLDNMESAEKVPIVYTRRERFLDEELDDTKDVITSKTAKESEKLVTVPEQKLIKLEDEPNQNVPSIASPIGPADVSNDRKLTSSYLEQQFKTLLTTEQQQQLLKASLNYDMLNFNESPLKDSANSKSCTQSSSISDVVDLEETAQLRRQQLNRVAEWVQNNSRQNAAASSSRTSYTSSTIDNSPISPSMEKSSIDSGYKTTKQLPNGNCAPNLTPPIAPGLTSDSIAQNNYIYNYKYYQDGSGVKGDMPQQQQKSQQVDLAQMEYNVKQFLLKQNEWSIRSRAGPLSSSPAKLVSNSRSSSSHNNNSYHCSNSVYNDSVIDVDVDLDVESPPPPPIPMFKSNYPHRTETNL